MPLSEDQKKDVKWALVAFSASVQQDCNTSALLPRGTLFEKYSNYYNGAHPMQFATAIFRETFGNTFRANTENLCQLPVDVLADLLQVEGFAARNQADEASAAETAEIWRRNRMRERAGQVHKNTLLFGEGFVIVWPDDEMRPVIYPNFPGNVVVKYHSEQIGYITQAAKYWSEDGFGRLTIYTPDLITRYRTRNRASQMPVGVAHFELYGTDDVKAEQVNPYGKVPVFRFVNNAAVGGLGESELRNVVPAQDRLNKGICDMLIASEYSAYPQRYALGYEARKDPDTGKIINPFQSGANRVWFIEDPRGKIDQLTPGDITQHLAMITDARMAIARISGIPPHYFGMDAGGWPSGESLKTSSERLTRKAKDRQESFGNTWADVMRFCLEIAGMPGVELETRWSDPTPRLSELVSWQAAQIEQQVGGSREKILRERGYSEKDIEQAEIDRQRAAYGEGVPRNADDNESEAEAA